MRPLCFPTYSVIQEDSYTEWFSRKCQYLGGGGDSVCFCEKKKVYMDMCLIRNGYRDRDVWIWRALFAYPSIRFLFVGLDEERRLQKKKLKINLEKQQAIFAHEMESALRLTVGSSNIYYEL
jgi:hypothetical protein